MFAQFRKHQRAQPFHYTTLPVEREIILPHYGAASRQAEEFHKSTKDIRYLFGGDRSGKTGTCAYELISQMRQCPGERFWSVALTEDLISAIWEWHQEFTHPSERPEQNISWGNKGRQIPREWRHPNGSIMEYKTAASRAGVFSAKKIKGIHLDEDMQRVTPQGEAIFDECLSRISEGGFLVGSATPVLGKNWLYDRIYKKNIRNREDGLPDPDIEWWQVSRADNRYHSKEMIEKARNRMSKDVRERRFYGRFITLSGAVFREWDEKVHFLSEVPEISADWRRIRVLDLGTTVFCCLWMALDGMGRIWVYDEYYSGGRLVKDHAREIREITESHYTMFSHIDRFRPIEISISDHDKQVRIELDAHGVPTTPADKRVELGVEYVNQYLMTNEVTQPRLFVSPRCPNTARECEGYHYKIVKPGSEDKEVIDKVNDHTCDALRYGTIYFVAGRRNYKVRQ